MLLSLTAYLLFAASPVVASALAKSSSVKPPKPSTTTKPPVKPTDVLYYDNGQCGGTGYKGPTDCSANYNPETPSDHYWCVVVTKDYFACSLDNNIYGACANPATAPKNGEICAVNGEGPHCCAGYPNSQCILLNDDALTSKCFEVKNPPPPPSATPTPTPVPCRPKWAQCGGIGWTGATCCADEPSWTCVRSNDWFSQCLQNTAWSSTTSTTSKVTKTTSATPAPSNCVANWGQCGGQGYPGPRCCQDEPAWFCEYENQYFSNCHRNPNVTTTTTTKK